MSPPSRRSRVSDAKRAVARSRAAFVSAWRSGRPTPFVNSGSPVKSALAFSRNAVLSFVWPGVWSAVITAVPIRTRLP
jgi:hypothetical protein